MVHCPVYVITLDRQKLRTALMKSFLKEIKAKNVKWIRGVDGRKLAASSGRLRTMGKHVRLSWTDSSSKERCVKRLQLGNTYTLGLANTWGMLGCSLSHMMALRRGLAARSPYFIILENDCRSSAPQFFWQMVKTALATMPKRWSLLQLGSATAGPAPMSWRKCVRATICGKGRTFKLRVAERCCLAHAYLISATGAAEMLRLMESGRIPDTAFMSMQSSALRAKTPKSQCFHFSPSWVDQQRPTEFDPSTTCTLQSWRKGLAGTLTSRQRRKTQKSKHNGARTRLNAKITRRAARTVKKAAGEAGGLKRAGNGSSVKNVHKKSQKLLTSYRRTGTWPSKREAHRLWGRLKAEHVR